MGEKFLKTTAFFEKLLLLNFSIFLLLGLFFQRAAKYTLYAGVFFWLLINILRYNKRFYRGFVPLNPLNRNFLFFGIACVFSIFSSLNPNHSQAIFFDRYFQYAILFWMGMGIARASRINLRILIYVFMVFGCIFGIGGVKDIMYYNWDRLETVYSKYMPYYGLPLFLTFLTPLNVLIFLFAKKLWLRILGLINSALLFPCLICNNSRAAWIAVSFSLIIVSSLKNRKVAIATFIILIALVSVSFFSPARRERLEETIDPAKWSYRIPLFKSAIAIFRDYPIFGAGIGMYEKLLHTPKYELPSDYPVPKELNLHAHNNYLEMAAEMGLVGLLAFILIFVSFFKNAFKLIIQNTGQSQDEHAIFLGISGIVLAVLIFAFSSTIITVGVTVPSYFWFLFGLAASFLCP